MEGSFHYKAMCNGACSHKTHKCPVIDIYLTNITVDDLKIAECFIAMHNYAVYQSALS